jgi:hypothetical protein
MSRIFGIVRSPYSLEQVLKTGNSARDNHFTDVSNILFSDGGNYQNDTAIISNDITTLFFEQNTADTSINILENPVIGQYYNSTNQFINQNGFINFDSSEDWTYGNAFTLSGSTDFVCNISGIYNLDCATTIDSSGSTWTNGTRRTLGIQINRGGSGLTTFLSDAYPLSSITYSINTLGTIKLFPGDIVKFQITGALLTGTGVQVRGNNSFDRNTYFNWRLIKPT